MTMTNLRSRHILVVIFGFLTCKVVALSRPNIVFIVADDLGWNDVSFHGSNQIPTPNINKLAYNGIILNNYYVSPICTPTRSAIMTGRHPIHTGLQHSVIVGSQPYGLPLNLTTMPQHFNQLGYTSKMVGKWHLGFMTNEYTPTYRGFDSHFGYYLGEEDYLDHTSEANAGYWGLDFRRNMEVVRNAMGLYSTEIFTEEAVKIINTHNTSTPLFLYLPYQAVHSGNPDEEPLEAPQKYVDRFPNIANVKRKIFAGMVSALDDGVGNVTRALVDRGMMENTIIVFTTDNGGPANGFDYNAASNWPLRGVKATLWEGGVRGVGFISSQLLKKSSYVSDHMMHICDWLPTLYSAAGGDASSLKNLDGFNLWDMLSNNSDPVRKEILHNIDPIAGIAAMRVGDYKLVIGQTYDGDWSGWYPPWQAEHDGDVGIALETGDLKFMSGIAAEHGDDQISTLHTKLHGQRNSIMNHRVNNKPVVVICGTKPANASTNCRPTVKPCLYYIPTDPCEYNNIADQEPAIVKVLLGRIAAYNATAVPPLNYHLPQDPAGNPKLHGGVWGPWR